MQIARSDLFLAPSLFENAPYAILEAMVLKLPVLGSDTGGINEIIEHKKTGMLFSLTELDSLYKCINELVNNGNLRKSLALNAYRYVCSNHNPRKIAQETVEFYNTISV
jgi:glycosyltransferase involved in cell wall biosynthesis